MTNDERRLAAEARRRTLDGTAKVICRAAGLSLDDIASRTGASKVTIWRWLEGHAAPRGTYAVAFAQLLREVLPVAAENLDQEESAAARMREEADSHLRAVAKLRLDIRCDFDPLAA